MGQPATDFGNKTLAAMRLLVYEGIRRKSTDPLAGLQAASVNSYIAKWDAFFVDYARWNLATFKMQKMVEYKTGTTLLSSWASGDLYLELTSNANAASGGGRVSVNGDLIDYSAKGTPTALTSLTISTVAGKLTPDVSHVTGERLEFLVAAPADMGKPGNIWFAQAGSKATFKLSHRSWLEMPIPTGRYYTYHDGFFLFPQNLTTQNLQLHYWKKGLKLVDGDSLQTPEKWDDVVRYGAIAECALITKEYDVADSMFARAGLPNPRQPGSELNGILQWAAGMDSVQTDSNDEVFTPDLGSLHM